MVGASIIFTSSELAKGEVSTLVAENEKINGRAEQSYVYHSQASTGSIIGLIIIHSQFNQVPFSATVISPNAKESPQIFNSTNGDSEFKINPISVGDYTLKISNLGYQSSVFDITFGRYSGTAESIGLNNMYAISGFAVLAFIGGIILLIIGIILGRRDRVRQKSIQQG